MSNLQTRYQIILNELRKLSPSERFYFKPIKQKCSDIELISLIIFTEFKSFNSEYQLFREIQAEKLPLKWNELFTIDKSYSFIE